MRADALGAAEQQPHLARLGGVAADFVVDLLNLRLTLLDRDFDARDYALLLALDESSGRYSSADRLVNLRGGQGVVLSCVCSPNTTVQKHEEAVLG